MQRRIMGKQGPCCHCGISSVCPCCSFMKALKPHEGTPLWRNGPAEKPVLCNACGSRWRTKGSLANYMPMHLGIVGPKNASIKKTKQKTNEEYSHKRKEPSSGFSEYSVYSQSEYHENGMLDDDASTRSSTGSGISFSESCAQYTPTTVSTSESWPPWGFHVPSKRRSAMHHHRLPMNQYSSSLLLSEPHSYRHSSEEDLLVDCKPLSATEIGLGGVFIKSSMSILATQDSQASSLIYDNSEMEESVQLNDNLISEWNLDVDFQSIKRKGKEKTTQLARNTGLSCTGVSKSQIANKALLDKFPYSKRDVLQSCHSPLVFVELKDVINFDTFMGLLTDQEQHQLVKQVSSSDTQLNSLRCMFSCVQFENSLRLFQTLLSEGMFDSASGLSPKVLQHYQHLLSLPDLRPSGWIERCSQISSRAKRKNVMEYGKIIQGKQFLKEKMKSLTFMGLNHLPADGVRSFVSAATSDQRAQTSLDSWSVLSDDVTTYHKDRHQIESTCKEPNPLLQSERCHAFSNRKANKPREKRPDALHHGRKSPMRNYRSMEAPSYGVVDHDILLDLPSNLSFQQAELLQQPVWSSKPQPALVERAQKSDSNVAVENPLAENEPDLEWTGLLWNSPSSGSVSHSLY